MKKFGKILTLSLAALMLVACDDVLAKPTQVLDKDHLVEISGDKGVNNYDNNYEVIYDQLINSGSANEIIMEALVEHIASNEVAKFYDLTAEEFNAVFDAVLESLKNHSEMPSTLTKNAQVTLFNVVKDYVEDHMIEKANGASYLKDNQFYEVKLVNDLKVSLYDIEGTNYHEPQTITNDSKYNDVLNCDYSDYIKKEIFPVILKELLTSVYIYEQEYTSLGKAYARETKYIKLENISNHLDSVSVLLNGYLNAYVDGTLPTSDFSLDSLSRIYRGVNLTTEEETFVNELGITTKHDIIEEELLKVGTLGVNGEYTIHPLSNKNRSEELISSYTGSYAYPVSHGKVLKERELEKLDIVYDDELVVKSGGYTSLPSDLRSRLFSSSVGSFTKTLETADEQKSITFLTPKSAPSTSNDLLTQYACFDADSNAYYLIIVENYYNTTKLKEGNSNDKDVTLNQDTKDKALEIARKLSTSSNNQKDAILHYFEKYGLEFGDQNFYDYIESTYPDLVED